MTERQFTWLKENLNKEIRVADILMELMFWHFDCGEILFFLEWIKIINMNKGTCMITGFGHGPEKVEPKIDWKDPNPIVTLLLRRDPDDDKETVRKAVEEGPEIR